MQMEHYLQEFRDTFEIFFIKGLPPFWDGKGKLYNQEEYNSLLTQCRMDHSKFEGIEENLKGPSLVEYLSTDFEILNEFKIVKIGLSIMSYAMCINLEILIKEMMDYEIPSNSQWKEIVRLGKTKCIFPRTSKYPPGVTKPTSSTEDQGKKNVVKEDEKSKKSVPSFETSFF
jgi:hypothetical protein